MTEYTNPFSVCFNMMKIRYATLGNSIDDNFLLHTDSQINVFISLESILCNLSMIRDVDNKLLMQRDFPVLLESEMINICAHYRHFFTKRGDNPRIFLYYTDLSSETYNTYQYNDEYRSYYMLKYMQNPKFSLLGKKMVEIIVPQVQTILDFIPGVYLIKATGIEGSLIPLIIGKQYPGSKNFIITSERYDTQYFLYPNNFSLRFLKRSPSGGTIFTNNHKYLKDLFNDNHDSDEDVNIFDNSSFYSTLLATVGDKSRSIEPLKGIGCKTLAKLIHSGIGNGQITNATTSIDMISQIFPYDIQQDVTNSFKCIDLEFLYHNITQKDIFNILSQIIDRSDYNSLSQLNKELYFNYPLMLQELTESPSEKVMVI